MTAATTLVPFQPAPGLTTRYALARAHDYIDKISKKHDAATKGLAAIVTVAKRHGKPPGTCAPSSKRSLPAYAWTSSRGSSSLAADSSTRETRLNMVARL